MLLGTLFELSQSHPRFAAHPEDPELLAIPRYPGPVLITGLPNDFLILAAGPFLSSLCFMGPKAYPFVGLGLKSFLMDLGLPSFSLL